MECNIIQAICSHPLFQCFEAVCLRINNKIMLISELREENILLVTGDGFSDGYLYISKSINSTYLYEFMLTF